jgi:hypothetical protein
MIPSQRGAFQRIAYVLASVEMMETTPDGIFSKADCLESYPKPFMSVALKVVMT